MASGGQMKRRNFLHKMKTSRSLLIIPILQRIG
jgi:hypothetical protein